mgnify:CR=1 FL=1
MKQYLDLVKKVLENGNQKGDRTGTGTKSIFGHQLRFDLSKGFPMITTKKLHLKSIIHELLWFINGDTNISYLNENGVKIWNEWANKDGDLGPVYGYQWRNWNGDEIDQIKELISTLKNNPNSRRMLVSAWNPSVLPDTSKSFEESCSAAHFDIASETSSFPEIRTLKFSILETISIYSCASGSSKLTLNCPSILNILGLIETSETSS